MRRKLLVAILLFFASKPMLAHEEDSFDNKDFYVVQKGDSLYKLATDYDVGLNELLQANPQITDINRIYAQQKILLPITHILPDAPQKGIVINLAEPRIYYFPDDESQEIQTFPIAVGADQKTPTGKTKVAAKRENPSWIPTQSIREEDPSLPEIVPPGPNNPLGNYLLELDASHHYKWQNIRIHGTNDPRSIGGKVSHGCIRLYPQDIETLFAQVEVGAPVTIVDQPIKVAEENGVFIEVHWPEKVEAVFEEMGIRKIICKKIKNCDSYVDWNLVDKAVIENLGVPVAVGVNLD